MPTTWVARTKPVPPTHKSTLATLARQLPVHNLLADHLMADHLVAAHLLADHLKVTNNLTVILHPQPSKPHSIQG